MKRIMLLIAFVFCVFMAQGQKTVQVLVDYSHGVYKGNAYEKFQVIEPDFVKDRPRYEGRFFEELSESCHHIVVLTDTQNADEQTVRVYVLEVSRKGKVKAQVDFMGRSVLMYGKGGTFGTFLNLFGDGMESLGEKLGEYLNRWR